MHGSWGRTLYSQHSASTTAVDRTQIEENKKVQMLNSDAHPYPTVKKAQQVERRDSRSARRHPANVMAYIGVFFVLCVRGRYHTGLCGVYFGVYIQIDASFYVVFFIFCMLYFEVIFFFCGVFLLFCCCIFFRYFAPHTLERTSPRLPPPSPRCVSTTVTYF